MGWIGMGWDGRGHCPANATATAVGDSPCFALFMLHTAAVPSPLLLFDCEEQRYPRSAEGESRRGFRNVIISLWREDRLGI